MPARQLIHPLISGIAGMISIDVLTSSAPAAAQPGIDRPPFFGYYQIKEAGNGKCLDVKDHGTADGTPVQLWDCANSKQANQVWVIGEIFTGAGRYYVRSQESGKCLHTSPQGNGIRFNIAACPDGGIGASQLFVIKPVTFLGQFWVKPTISPSLTKCMDADVSGGTNVNGVRINQWDCNQNPIQWNQLWTFVNVGP